jgi:hypothetical protein
VTNDRFVTANHQAIATLPRQEHEKCPPTHKISTHSVRVVAHAAERMNYDQSQSNAASLPGPFVFSDITASSE